LKFVWSFFLFTY